MVKETLLVLNRSDLNLHHKNTNIDYIDRTMFNITKEDIEQASIIFFVDTDHNFVYLKHRYESTIGYCNS